MSYSPDPQWKPAPEPDARPEAPPRRGDDNRAVWYRGGWMLALLVLFSVAHTLLIATAVLQFGWMLFAKKSNPHISDFGAKLGNWMAINARYQAVASEEKPFPWTEWK